ncbi:selenocysteine lyase/cysteine desulfurase [Methylohalomonas lacus]|uniref:Selenocysteine lyase/cysteine desulfurase n=1 Tax=Methylohalomonas lacus TaxID=398773 RepID=A0AAE3HHZ6_9GAMM|nr:aminotransferase class V-fold PLP-dependent enzyme [Methylohalomonas lacus]MCS3902644.1 selenocysteine lyase/cysteine desulfurase [Methylohalomonas lacus]
MNAEQLAAEFPLDPDLVYLNHAAVAPWPTRTATAVQAFAQENCQRGAAGYKQWLTRDAELRQQLGDLINAPSVDDIALVKNTSEALSMVAGGLDWRYGENVVSSNEEFPSNRIVWEAQKRFGVEFREVDLQTVTDPEQALMDACDGRTRVLTVSSVQYGSGLKLELARLGRFCREHGILFCVDAIQSLGAQSLDVQAIQADFVMADAHKWLLGPEGIAAFYCAAEHRYQLKLHEFGWHMVQHMGDYSRREWRPAASARRFECGSPNMLGIYAFSASLSLLQDVGMANVEQQVLDNAAYTMAQLRSVPGAKLITPANRERHAGIVTFRIPDRDAGDLHARLMANNVICAPRGGGIRLSPHFYTPREKIDKAVTLIRELC